MKLKKLYYKLFKIPHVENIISIDGVQRGGTHAVGNWLIHQLKDSEYQIQPTNRFDFPEIYSVGQDLMVNAIEKYMTSPERNYLEDVIKTRKPENLIFIHENPSFLLAQEHGVRYLNVKDAIVLRDPFNNFASCMNSFGTVPAHIIKNWTDLARSAVNGDRYTILYNNWFSVSDYRRKVCSDMKIPFTDFGINAVPDFGGGSSFDKMGMNGYAQNMKVLTRFHKYWRNQTFLDVFLNNPEIVELSDKLFGIIKETENFRRN